MPWSVAYEVDWRDVFTSIGAVNLNAPGSTLTFDGVTWRTPAIADGNPVDQVASTSWALEAGGLRAVSPNNPRFNATNNSAPHIYATLQDLAANSATPFEADSTRKYIFQAFVSDITVPGTNESGAGVAIYKVDQGGTIGNANFGWAALGHFNVTPNNFDQAGTGGAPGANSRPDVAPQGVCSLHYAKSGARMDMYCTALVADDWPANGSFNYVGSWRPTSDLDNDIVCDNRVFRVALVHNAPTPTPNAYDATIERFRILQF